MLNACSISPACFFLEKEIEAEPSATLLLTHPQSNLQTSLTREHGNQNQLNENN